MTTSMRFPCGGGGGGDSDTCEIRVVWQDGEPWFKATDLGRALRLVNVRKSLTKFAASEKKLFPFWTPSGTKRATFLSETGMYRLVAKTQTPVAAELREWMFGALRDARANSDVAATLRRASTEDLVAELARRGVGVALPLAE